MLDGVNAIHMNGRVYDPALGRFLSVDPVFQFPTNTQSLNPYTYVLNSPLTLTDPTGLTAAGSFGSGLAAGGGVFDRPATNCDTLIVCTREQHREWNQCKSDPSCKKPSAGGGSSRKGKSNGGDSGGSQESGSGGESSPDSIGGVAQRTALEGGFGDGGFVEPTAGDIDIMSASNEQLSKLSNDEREFVLTQRAMVSGTTRTLEGNLSAAQGRQKLGQATDADVAEARTALSNWSGAMRTYSPIVNGNAAAQTYTLENGSKEVVYFKSAVKLFREGNSKPDSSQGYFVKVPPGVKGLLYMNLHESGHMIRSRQYDPNGRELPQPVRENNADSWLQNMIDNRIVR